MFGRVYARRTILPLVSEEVFVDSLAFERQLPNDGGGVRRHQQSGRIWTPVDIMILGSIRLLTIGSHDTLYDVLALKGISFGEHPSRYL